MLVESDALNRRERFKVEKSIKRIDSMIPGKQYRLWDPHFEVVNQSLAFNQVPKTPRQTPTRWCCLVFDNDADEGRRTKGAFNKSCKNTSASLGAPPPLRWRDRNEKQIDGWPWTRFRARRLMPLKHALLLLKERERVRKKDKQTTDVSRHRNTGQKESKK